MMFLGRRINFMNPVSSGTEVRQGSQRSLCRWPRHRSSGHSVSSGVWSSLITYDRQAHPLSTLGTDILPRPCDPSVRWYALRIAPKVYTPASWTLESLHKGVRTVAVAPRWLFLLLICHSFTSFSNLHVDGTAIRRRPAWSPHTPFSFLIQSLSSQDTLMPSSGLK